ncbi:Bug family tripartite tricarboxylate transporter substrate binding protein [Noviherbaspirillum galbum]|uniref:Tripartite tricarboxylate transporter substrate binding protein n=1 Tax=Noviherbaspirillum galbum TaxID=2709383 RepID=A0A6B3ST19_9BURK|nr:tripartite tricarboxylate transporter substrate binding protein [Noviherbaspirillum galbum]NEX62485.1 tripartite tricarboxylate transporter substrate binding protein [Noviherbaspirillum galbum]
MCIPRLLRSWRTVFLAIAAIASTGAALPALASPPAQAGAWPTKAIRFIVAAPGGSSLDVIARLLADRLRERLGQPLIVDNIPGASGTIATTTAAKAAPDGQTILLSYNGPLASTQFLTRLPYQPLKDLSPVVLTSSQPNVLAVNPGVPARNVAELIAYLKKNPGKLNYASVGNGSSSHLTMELFKNMTGTFVVHIPYNGAPPAATSLIAGDTQMLFSVPSAIVPHAKSGKARILAVSGATRFSLLPDTPTLAESGLLGFESLAWNGVLVPAGTSPEIIQRLNREINAILAMPDVKARLHNVALEPAGGTPEAFGAWMGAEAKKWQEVVRRTGATLD